MKPSETSPTQVAEPTNARIAVARAKCAAADEALGSFVPDDLGNGVHGSQEATTPPRSDTTVVMPQGEAAPTPTSGSAPTDSTNPAA